MSDRTIRAATPGTVRVPYGEGVYRRRILLRSRPGEATADLEDDFHRFRVTIKTDGVIVTHIDAEAARHPWSTCPLASEPLRALVGMKLSPRSTAVADRADPRANCMHMFDLAGLAIAHAARQRGTRLYDIAVPDRVEGRTTPTLARDGHPLLTWSVAHQEITDPEPFRARDMTRGAAFLPWCEAALDPDLAEAAIILRRACIISLGRFQDLDQMPSAGVLLPMVRGTCFTFTEGVAEGAMRVIGSTHELTNDPDQPLSDLVPLLLGPH